MKYCQKASCPLLLRPSGLQVPGGLSTSPGGIQHSRQAGPELGRAERERDGAAGVPQVCAGDGQL